MTLREQTEALEREMLSPFACLSSQSRGRQTPLEPCPTRTCFQRDIDRIIHSKAFRRLKHKTQVFLEPEGDHLPHQSSYSHFFPELALYKNQRLSYGRVLLQPAYISSNIHQLPLL